MANLQEKRLAELRKSVSQMTDEELYEHIGASRNNRHKPPEKKAKKKASSKKGKGSSKKSDSLEDQLSNLSAEDAAELLKKLQNQ